MSSLILINFWKWFVTHLSAVYDQFIISYDTNRISSYETYTDYWFWFLLQGGSGGADQSSAAQVASSPPFFCGSPPSRVSNPLIQDARFGDEKVTPVSPRAIPIPSGMASSPSASTRKGGCVRVNFGNNPAVRVEGFDCLDRDRRNCSIPALA